MLVILVTNRGLPSYVTKASVSLRIVRKNHLLWNLLIMGLHSKHQN